MDERLDHTEAQPQVGRHEGGKQVVARHYFTSQLSTKSSIKSSGSISNSEEGSVTDLAADLADQKCPARLEVFASGSGECTASRRAQKG